jgi:hypothetical protein
MLSSWNKETLFSSSRQQYNNQANSICRSSFGGLTRWGRQMTGLHQVFASSEANCLGRLGRYIWMKWCHHVLKRRRRDCHLVIFRWRFHLILWSSICFFATIGLSYGAIACRNGG